MKVSFHFCLVLLPSPLHIMCSFHLPKGFCSTPQFASKQITQTRKKKQAALGEAAGPPPSPPFEVLLQVLQHNSEPSQSESLYFRSAVQSGRPHLHKVRNWSPTRQPPGPIGGGSGLEGRQSGPAGSGGRSRTWRRRPTHRSGGSLHQWKCAGAGLRPIRRGGQGRAGLNLAPRVQSQRCRRRNRVCSRVCGSRCRIGILVTMGTKAKAGRKQLPLFTTVVLCKFPEFGRNDRSGRRLEEGAPHAPCPRDGRG